MSASGLAEYQEQFIELMVRSGVVTFGDFTTKSGRSTPYFVNSGNFCTGHSIGQAGKFYADALMAAFGGDFDNLYGPAYKGIPLAVATAAALARNHDHAVSFTFNRKEVKDHGEGGGLVGHRYCDGDKVIIIEDVMTAGTSIEESVPRLRAAADIELKGIIVAVDRQERGSGDCSACREISDKYGVPVTAIVTLDQLVGYLADRQVDGQTVLTDEILSRIREYRSQYGAS